MSQGAGPRTVAADAAMSLPAEVTLRHHAALCQLALPLSVPDGGWRRDVGTAAVDIAPGSDGPAAPSGRFLRLLIMHVCDAAARTSSATVGMGPSAAAFASGIGAETDEASLGELAEQLTRLTSAKVTVSLDGGPALAVFDARARSRALTAEWRPGVRLNARFRASLAEATVPLDRRVVRALADSPAALDAYAWIRHALARAAAGQVVTTPWEDLLRRFGEASQNGAAFRRGFEDALRRVFTADLSVSIAVDDDGVSVRHAAPEDGDSTSCPTPQASRTPAPGESPEPERAEPPVPRPPAMPTRNQRPEPSPVPEPRISGQARVVAPAAPTQDRLGMASLRSNLTGLPQVIWLRRANGDRHIVIGVTPDARLDPDRLTVLAVEPVVLQVSGGLFEQDFERVSAWVMVNRDLIDDFWDGQVVSIDEVSRRARKVPAVGWR